MMKTLSTFDIEALFRTHVKINDNPEYSKRYAHLPLERNNKRWKWEGKDFPRVIAVLEFARYCSAYGFRPRHLLTFNALSDPEVEYLEFSERSNFEFADNPVDHDLHTLRIADRDYDFLMLNQTIEHLYNPYLCLENAIELLVPGAFIYANVPTVNIAHSTPFHYVTGVTPTGLACLFSACELEVLEVGQWGNLEYINKMFRMQSWPDYRQIKDYRGDFNNPVISWILARKST